MTGILCIQTETVDGRLERPIHRSHVGCLAHTGMTKHDHFQNAAPLYCSNKSKGSSRTRYGPVLCGSGLWIGDAGSVFSSGLVGSGFISFLAAYIAAPSQTTNSRSFAALGSSPNSFLSASR